MIYVNIVFCGILATSLTIFGDFIVKILYVDHVQSATQICMDICGTAFDAVEPLGKITEASNPTRRCGIT